MIISAGINKPSVVLKLIAPFVNKQRNASLLVERTLLKKFKPP